MLCLTGFTACEKEDLPVKFIDINDTGLARFEVKNKTGQDVATLTAEFTYFSEFDRAIMIDTVDYRMKNRQRAFLKAGEETSLVQKVPEATVSATGRVLKFEFVD